MSHGIVFTASAIFQSANSSKVGRELNYTMGVRWIQLIDEYVQLRKCKYSQETLQNKNIHKYKLQMIYFRDNTRTPTHLLAQFLQIP